MDSLTKLENAIQSIKALVDKFEFNQNKEKELIKVNQTKTII